MSNQREIREKSERTQSIKIRVNTAFKYFVLFLFVYLTGSGAIGVQVRHQLLLLCEHGLEGVELTLELLDGDLGPALGGGRVLGGHPGAQLAHITVQLVPALDLVTNEKSVFTMSGPIRVQYSGHVTCLDQSEAGIFLPRWSSSPPTP